MRYQQSGARDPHGSSWQQQIIKQYGSISKYLKIINNHL